MIGHPRAREVNLVVGNYDGGLQQRSRWRLALVLYPALVLAIVFGVLHAVTPPPAPTNVKPGAPLGPRLADHVLLVIADGLRYDVATDPARMPHFASAMRTHVSGEIWAGRISMTSSAVLTLGTGQHGRVEQVLRNLHAERPPYNSWLANARAAGLRLAVVGEPAWVQLYGPEFGFQRSDPEGVAIDVDFNDKTFADAREALRTRPDLLIAHFVTPDHQGHAYGIGSPRYREHIRNFDRMLASFLDELDSTWTVVVTSDHGAADSGTHGTDVAVQRRCPIYAYGPGLVATRASPVLRLEQVDLSTTLPTLLGVPAPAHGTGRALVEWLELSDERRAAIACENARGVVTYADDVRNAVTASTAMPPACADRASAPALRIHAAAQAIRAADASVTEARGLGSRSSFGWLAVIAVLCVSCVLSAWPKPQLAPFLAGAALIAATVGLVLGVERLPSVWPNVVRGGFFVIANVVLVGLLVRPAWVARWFERVWPYSALAPGALAVSYPADTRPESAAIALVVSVYMVVAARDQTGKNGARSFGADLWPLTLGLLALVPIALRENATYSALVTDELTRRLLITLAVGTWVGWFSRRLGLSNRQLTMMLAAFIAPLWLRPLLGPALGRTVVGVTITIFLLTLFTRARAEWRIIAGLVSVLWVCRDFETVPLLGTITIAYVVGRALETRSRVELCRSDLVFGTLLGFALLFALRMGLQDGLEFGGFDWGAGAFKDPKISPVVVGATLAYKYAAGAVLIVLALAARLPRVFESGIVVGLALCLLVRVTSLSGMFFFGGSSYWTALRVLGDLPTAAVMGFGCVLYLAARLPAPAPLVSLRRAVMRASALDEADQPGRSSSVS